MKKNIFGAIVTLIVCACIFGILCVTDVISFNKNDTNNNTQNEVKETKLCEKAKTIDGKEYKLTFYKLVNGEKNNKIDLLVNGKSIYNTILDYYISDEALMNSKDECEKYFSNSSDLINIKKVTADDNYNYYLYSVNSITNLAVSENLKTKEFKSLKDLGKYEYLYGVVKYETFQSNPNVNECLDRNIIDVVDNYISELVINTNSSKITTTEGEKEAWTTNEEKYTFKDGNIEKVKSNQKYVVVCNTPW